MSRPWLTALAVSLAAAAIFAATNRGLVAHLDSVIQNDRAPRGIDGDRAPPIAMDPLQMAYLTWAAGDAARHGQLLVADRHQFANRVERFFPMVLDPLVYVGGWLSTVAPLPLAYNVAQVLAPLFILVLAFYRLSRTLELSAPIAAGLGLLCGFIPYRLLNSTMGQHNAASVCLLPIFHWLVARALIIEQRRGRAIAVASGVLLLIGFSEEHLAVSAALFAWPFVLVHLAIFRRQRGGTAPFAWAWLATIGREFAPSLPALAGLVAVALVERHFLLHQSIVRHVYDYGVVAQYSSEFHETYFHKTVGYHFVLLPLTLAGCCAAAARFFRAPAADRVGVLRVAFALVFVSSAVLSLGPVTLVTRILHVNLYRFLFEHVPLLDMQRYPHRLCYVAYVSGLVMVGVALETFIDKLAQPDYRRRVLSVAAGVALAAGAVDWAARRPATALYDLSRDANGATDEAVRRTAGASRIVLMLPASNGSNWSDSRVLLRLIHTGGRFFNGYWSYVPMTYWNLVGSFIRLGSDGALYPILEPDLRRVGVEYLLVDKAFIREPAIAALRRQPALRLVHEDTDYAYFAMDGVTP